jgi:hypothetical protein
MFLDDFIASGRNILSIIIYTSKDLPLPLTAASNGGLIIGAVMTHMRCLDLVLKVAISRLKLRDWIMTGVTRIYSGCRMGQLNWASSDSAHISLISIKYCTDCIIYKEVVQYAGQLWWITADSMTIVRIYTCTLL